MENIKQEIKINEDISIVRTIKKVSSIHEEQMITQVLTKIVNVVSAIEQPTLPKKYPSSYVKKSERNSSSYVKKGTRNSNIDVTPEDRVEVVKLVIKMQNDATMTRKQKDKISRERGYKSFAVMRRKKDYIKERYVDLYNQAVEELGPIEIQKLKSNSNKGFPIKMTPDRVVEIFKTCFEIRNSDMTKYQKDEESRKIGYKNYGVLQAIETQLKRKYPEVYNQIFYKQETDIVEQKEHDFNKSELIQESQIDEEWHEQPEHPVPIKEDYNIEKMDEDQDGIKTENETEQTEATKNEYIND